MPGMSRGFRARSTSRSNSAESMPGQLATGAPRDFLEFSRWSARKIADNSIVMNPLLRDFYGHQVWADAEHWRAIEAHPAAAEDAAIKSRLHHIHMVQRIFLWSVGDRATSFGVSQPQ